MLVASPPETPNKPKPNKIGELIMLLLKRNHTRSIGKPTKSTYKLGTNQAG